jgi:hypothetical protein
MFGLVFVEGDGHNTLLHRELSARPVIVVCMLCYWKIACSKGEGVFYVSDKVIYPIEGGLLNCTKKYEPKALQNIIICSACFSCLHGCE